MTRTWWSDKLNRIRPNLLNLNPEVPVKFKELLGRDYDRFRVSGPPNPLEPYLLEQYGLDVSTTYAGLPVKNPWGKASGQLSMTPQQVAEDAAAGLGFCVLKTVIAQDRSGEQSMRPWAVPESRMVLERIRGQSGLEGWTVSWKGRGWWGTFEQYQSLLRTARQLALPTGMLIVPSCKFHLPAATSDQWRLEEYQFTTVGLLDAYGMDTQPDAPMPIEKDFSPTLAGSDLAADPARVLEWLRHVPRLIRESAGSRPIRVGLKIFNALADDAFQLRLLRIANLPGPDRPDFLVYANRLFDPTREFEGHRGIAVGGPDLSQRNLRVLAAYQSLRLSRVDLPLPEISGTGDISSGRMAVEYMLRGCSSLQLHTYFQLPLSEYAMQQGSRTARALHKLYFDPTDGFIVWSLHVAARLGLNPGQRIIQLKELVDQGKRVGNGE